MSILRVRVRRLGEALFLKLIGLAEVAGALGLVLPGLLRIGRSLTSLAAAGLAIIMVGATVLAPSHQGA